MAKKTLREKVNEYIDQRRLLGYHRAPVLAPIPCDTLPVDAPPKVIRSYKLFVDDMRHTPDGWIGARTVSEAIAILAALPVRVVSLDHDIIGRLGTGDLYQALSHETFKGVAYYIAAMPRESRPDVRIHTANAGAAKTMCEIMGLSFNDAYKHFDEGGY